jgi:hypothetical protein
MERVEGFLRGAPIPPQEITARLSARFLLKPMPRLDLRTCRDCGGHSTEVGLLSHTRRCADCAKRNYFANLDQLVSHRGPYFQKHRRACVAAFGGVILDDDPPAA